MFDFDGTIADTFDIFVGIAKEMAESEGLDSEAINRIEDFRDLGTRKMMAELGVSVHKIPSYAKKSQAIMNSRLDTVKIFPGIKEVLDKLLNKGVRLCLLSSNSLDNVNVVLKQNGLEKYFEFVIGGSSLFGKDKKIKEAIKKYKLNREDVYYFGDETRDIEGAKGAKVKAVAVTWGFNSKKSFVELNPDYTLDRVEEILDI
jgi:HAD superfamily hydrolase (TIGR01549 family)